MAAQEEISVMELGKSLTFFLDWARPGFRLQRARRVAVTFSTRMSRVMLI